MAVLETKSAILTTFEADVRTFFPIMPFVFDIGSINCTTVLSVYVKLFSGCGVRRTGNVISGVTLN
jgi:hypothetical protein